MSANTKSLKYNCMDKYNFETIDNFTIGDIIGSQLVYIKYLNGNYNCFTLSYFKNILKMSEISDDDNYELKSLGIEGSSITLTEEQYNELNQYNYKIGKDYEVKIIDKVNNFEIREIEKSEIYPDLIKLKNEKNNNYGFTEDKKVKILSFNKQYYNHLNNIIAKLNDEYNELREINNFNKKIDYLNKLINFIIKLNIESNKFEEKFININSKIDNLNKFDFKLKKADNEILKYKNQIIKDYNIIIKKDNIDKLNNELSRIITNTNRQIKQLEINIIDSKNKLDRMKRQKLNLFNKVKTENINRVNKILKEIDIDKLNLIFDAYYNKIEKTDKRYQDISTLDVIYEGTGGNKTSFINIYLKILEKYKKIKDIKLEIQKLTFRDKKDYNIDVKKYFQNYYGRINELRDIYNDKDIFYKILSKYINSLKEKYNKIAKELNKNINVKINEIDNINNQKLTNIKNNFYILLDLLYKIENKKVDKYSIEHLEKEEKIINIENKYNGLVSYYENIKDKIIEEEEEKKDINVLKEYNKKIIGKLENIILILKFDDKDNMGTLLRKYRLYQKNMNMINEMKEYKEINIQHPELNKLQNIINNLKTDIELKKKLIEESIKKKQIKNSKVKRKWLFGGKYILRMI